MDYKEIEKLMHSMQALGLSKIAIKQGDFEVVLEKEQPKTGRCHSHEMLPAISSEREHALTVAHPTLPPTLTSSVDSKHPVDTGLYVKSPLVGTFYATPSPQDPPFVKPGDRVDENTVIGIVEAMKVMNEIKAGVKGIIDAQLVENGHPVEFGTKIYQVKPV